MQHGFPLAAAIPGRRIRPGHQSATLLPVEIIEAPIDFPSAASPQQASHSEILIEVEKSQAMYHRHT
jgi:hypothetical protein